MTSILIAFSVVASIGLICAVLLALASHFLSVEEDHTQHEIRECLPGANCGACGYAGCDEYAKAVAAGEAKTNLCIPGADATAAEIAAILGTKAEDVIEMMLAGATAVEIGAQNLIDPFSSRDIINALPEVMDKYRINTLSEIIGGAK